MTDSVATLQAQLTALKSTRSSGVLKTRFGDREVTFRSFAELASAIGALETEIAAAQGTPRPTSIQIVSNKGW